MDGADDQERRARELADTTRRVLVGMNTGGIGAVLAIAASLAPQKVAPAWAVLPIGWFVIGLAATLVSLLLAKHRAIARRDALREGKEEPDFSAWRWRSFIWEIISSLAFVIGAAVGLAELSGLAFAQ